MKKKIISEKVKIFFSPSGKQAKINKGQNLLTITDYPGYDPEIKTYSKNPQKRGVDFGTYPGTKTYLLGLKLTY